MTWEQEQMEAEAKGIVKGEAKINKLNAILIAQNRFDDLKRSVVDKAFQNKLIEELGVTAY